jgi:hypothetical protein
LKFGDCAITAKGGTSALARCCSSETRWHEEHHLLAKVKAVLGAGLVPGFVFGSMADRYCKKQRRRYQRNELEIDHGYLIAL